MNDTLNKIKLRINTLKNRIVHIYCEEDNCCLTQFTHEIKKYIKTLIRRAYQMKGDSIDKI